MLLTHLDSLYSRRLAALVASALLWPPSTAGALNEQTVRFFCSGFFIHRRFCIPSTPPPSRESNPCCNRDRISLTGEGGREGGGSCHLTHNHLIMRKKKDSQRIKDSHCNLRPQLTSVSLMQLRQRNQYSSSGTRKTLAPTG